MKITQKIALYSLCLLLTISWGANCVSNIIKTTTEKNILDKKEALPENKTDIEEKKFEIAYEYLPSFSIPFQTTTTAVLQFTKVTAIPQSVFLDLSNPPPEFHLFA